MKFVGIFLCILFFSCSGKEKNDSSVLPVNEMRQVMWDMMRADQLVNEMALKDSLLDKKTETLKLYRQIFLLHNTSYQQFNKSLDYYLSAPKLFRPIIDSIAKKQIPVVRPETNRPFKKDSALKHLPQNNVQ